MKKSASLSALLAMLTLSLLPSCTLLQSATKVPGTILKSVARTAGMTVSQIDTGGEETPDIEVIGNGEIKQLD